MSAPLLPTISARTSTVPGAEGAVALYEARPAEAHAALVVVHEAFGVTDHIADVVRRAAAEGYHAVAPDLFHRGGGGVAPYGDLQAAAAYFGGMNGDDGILADVDAALDHLRGQGFADERIGVLGFCFGGRVAFLTGARRSLGAAVTLYGGGIMKANPFLPFPALTDDVATMRTPWLGMYGSQDHGIPAEEVDALEAAVAEAPVEARVLRYEGAGHAFHNDQLPGYHEQAAKAAWSEAMDWFRSHGVG
jgi:carboxymethylenebutenolidase